MKTAYRALTLAYRLFSIICLLTAGVALFWNGWPLHALLFAVLGVVVWLIPRTFPAPRGEE